MFKERECFIGANIHNQSKPLSDTTSVNQIKDSKLCLSNFISAICLSAKGLRPKGVGPFTQGDLCWKERVGIKRVVRLAAGKLNGLICFLPVQCIILLLQTSMFFRSSITFVRLNVAITEKPIFSSTNFRRKTFSSVV